MDQIVSMLKLLLFAGQETTSSLLNFIVYTLGKDPSLQEQLRNEFKKYDGAVIRFALNSTLIVQVIQEALRLHPPVYSIPRKAARDIIILDRCYIPKDWSIGIQTIYIHRDASRWGKDALEFNPKRCPIERQKNFAFGDGPHQCLGRHFAMTTAKIFLAAMVTQYSWKSLNGEIDQSGMLTLNLMEDIKIELHQLD